MRNSIENPLRSAPGTLLLAASLMIASLSAWAADRPKVLLNDAEFRDRVYACWLGKNIGGTLGMPFEGKKEPQNITYYTNLKPGEPAPNDDLDLQILWLKAMEEHGGSVDARILGQYWLKFVPVNWNEYGVGKKNMQLGLLPPLSGEFDNAKWKHSNGAWIRSELWACLAPGCPALAAQFAREDACVDHGAAEGTLAEIFTATIESAAFVERDRDRLLALGLSMIPKDCELAIAVRAAIAAFKEGKDWKEARQDVIRASEKTGWFQAPRNVAYTVLGWLYGEGDFGKSICTAVNCGDDTDCTGATLGSILGILGGTAGIPKRWSDPLGTAIKTVAVKGFVVPSNIGELTDRTVAMSRRVLEMRNAPVRITAGAADMSRVRELRLSDPAAARYLWGLSPYQILWNEKDLGVTLDYTSDPIIVTGAPRLLRVTVSNHSNRPESYQILIEGLPEGWRVDGLPTAPLRVGKGKSAILPLKVSAASATQQPYKMSLQVKGGQSAIIMPLTLIGR